MGGTYDLDPKTAIFSKTNHDERSWGACDFVIFNTEIHQRNILLPPTISKPKFGPKSWAQSAIYVQKMQGRRVGPVAQLTQLWFS